MNKSDIRIGYASMNMDVFPKTYKTCRKTNITNNKLREIISHNLKVLEATIDYNILNNNKLFRISSSLIPFGSSNLNTLNWADEFSDEFNTIKNKISANDIRISMHPGQYTVINSPHSHVVNNSINDLEYHTKLIELLAPHSSSNIIIHVGGIYSNKPVAIEKFISTYKSLSEHIKKYLVIENDEVSYTVEDVLYISSVTGILVVFDNLHHEINPSLEHMQLGEIVSIVASTWVSKKPKFHYSQQDSNKRVGAHSNSINLNDFIKYYNTVLHNVDIDIMLEVKDKNRSFIKVNQYFYPSAKVLEQQWAQYKYVMMAKSIHAYNNLRELFKNKNVEVQSFYEIIDDTLILSSSISDQINASQHIWGYLKSSQLHQKSINTYNMYIIKILLNLLSI